MSSQLTRLFGLIALFFSLGYSQSLSAATDSYSTGPGVAPSDGMCDVWQSLFNGWGLDPNGDEDKDGCSNLIESISGTDPRAANDCIRVGNLAISAGNVVFNFVSEAGKVYKVRSDDAPDGTFATVETLTFPGSGLSQYIPTEDGINEIIRVSKAPGSRKFYKLEVSDADSDNDGVSDWAERKTGTNPNSGTSGTNASGGAASDGAVMASLLSIQATVVTEKGFERVDKTATTPVTSPAKVGLTRSVGTMPLTLPITVAGGAIDATKANADAGDYSAISSISLPLNGGVGAAFEININPVQDSLDEVPEYAKATIGLPNIPNAKGPSATVCICDADPNNDGNDQLYVAYLGHEAGQATTASGYATALVNGDNTSASISVVFSNLSSEQNTAYIRSGPNSDLAPALPNGQVSGFNYNVAYKPGFYSTDQGFLDALRLGNIWCAITSANFTGKEIAGPFNKATGSVNFDPDNPTLDAPATGSPTWQTIANEQIERDIWRFMTQSTWGGTQAMYAAIRGKVDARVSALSGTPTAQQITDAYLTGLSDWLDEQMNPALTPSINFRTLVMAADNEEFELRGNKPYTYTNDPSFNGTRYAVTFDNAGNPIVSTTADNNFAGNNYPQSGPNRRREWWSIMLQGKDQVRQRFTQALSEIVIISEADQTTLDRHYGCANYWDMMAENAFGKYRTLLEKVTYSPMMGIYLSHMSNRAAYDAGGGIIVSPDENYAREIMQLFSIGLVLRHPDGSLQLDSAGLPIPTYDQRDITELARVMTGFSHGARHAVGYTSSWNNSTLAFNNSSNNRVSDLVVPNYGPSVTAANFSNGNNNWFGRVDDHLFWAAPWTTPMKVIGRISDGTPTPAGSIYYHDFNQYVDPDTDTPVPSVSKRLLAGKHGQYDVPMRTLPPLGRGANDITCHDLADLDLTAAHNALAGDPTQSAYGAGTQGSPGHTNTPVNICRWLIQRLTSSNPSAGYIFRVQEVYRNTNGNLGAVCKAILLDFEARSLQLADSSISHGKVKEPLVAFAQMLRTLRAFSGSPISVLKDRAPNMSGTDTPMPTAYPVSEYDKFSTDNANPPSLPTGWATGPFRYRFGDLTGNIGQSPQRAPSVFNWFLPDFVVPGPMAEAGLFAPELQINTEASVVAKANMFYAYTWSNLTGMSTQPGADSNVSDFILNNGNATPAVRLSLDGGVTFVNSVTFTPADFGAKTVTVVGGNTNWLTSVDNSLLRFSVSGAAGYDQLPVQPMTIGFQDSDSANEGIRAEHTSFNTWVQEGGKTDTVSVRLHAPPPAGTTVEVAVTTSGQVSVSPTPLTFTSTTWNSVQTVTVTAVQDAVTEAPSTAGDTLTFTATSTAASYNGLTATLPVGVVDNDDGASSYHVLVTEVGGDTVIGESTATAVTANQVDNFNIVLTKQPSANVTVTITPSNSQAQLNTTAGGTTYGSAGAAVTRTFTTVNWATAQEVRVRGNADTTVEASFEQNPTNNTILNVTANGGGYLTANPVQQVVAKIIDDDNRIIMTPNDGETIVQEGGVTDTFTVVLRVAPTVPVTVNLGSNHVRCTPTNLVFHPTGGSPGPGETIWNVAQTVTVTAIDDHLNEGRMMPLKPNAIPTVATATSTITSNAVTAITMTNQGAGYTVLPVVSFTGGGGSGAAGFPVLSADGKITGVTITAAGSGYTSAPTVTITPPFSGNAAIVASATSAGVADTGYNNYWSVTHSSLGVTILDNDNAGLNVVASGGNTTVVEGGVTDSVDISLRQQPSANVTVNLAASTQALVTPATLTFTPANWNTAQPVTITAINDTTVEPDTLTSVGVMVSSSDAAYNGVKTKSIAVTVIDNDFTPLNLGHSNGWTTVAEGGAAGNSTDTLVRVSDTFTVNLARAPTANVTVTLVTDGQITVSPSVLTFTSGNSGTNQTVTVTAVEDLTAETALHNSLLRFVITSTDPFYNNPRNTPMNIPVRDNDANGIALFETNGNTTPTEGGTDGITVVLTKAPASNVIVDLVSSNTAEATVPASLTFTTANWSTPQNFNVTAIGDMINEGREVYNVSVTARTTGSDAAYAGLTGWTYDGFKAVNNQVINYITDNHRRNENLIIVPSGGSIRSNDAQPTGGNTWVTEGSEETDSVEIYLASPPVFPVTVTLDANIQMGFSQSVFYFDSTNWNVPQTLVISAIDDAFNDVALAAAGNTAYNQAQNIQFRCFGDPTYFGIAPTHGVSILDNDSPAVSISQTGGITSTVESGATDTYNIVLTTPPNGNVVVTATPATGTTLNNATTGAKNFTFDNTNWNVPQVVTVIAAPDTSVEGNHQVNITHAINLPLTTDTTGYAAVNGSGASTLSLQTVVNNISDDDNRGIVGYTGLETRVHEDGSKSDTYSIVLRSAPSGVNTVTITPNVTGGFAAAGLAITPATLVFNSTDWNTPKFFTLTGVSNGIDAERARTVTISHTSASGDANYNAQSIHQVAVSQLSTDTPRIMFVGSPNIHENGNTGTYTVALNRAPTADVTVTATANSQLEIAPPVPAGATLVYGPNVTLTFTPTNWMTHQTVTVRAVDDALVESFIHYSGEVTHTSSSTDATYNNVSPLYKVVPLITDNEFPAVRILPSGGSTLITESGTADTYDIVLSQAPTADVTVSITPDAQSTVSAASVTFTSGNWSVPQSITVNAAADTTTEGNHTSTITHGDAVSADPAFSGLPVPFLLASITDNDGPQVQLVETSGSTTVVEGGTNDTFTVALSQAPTANVTVTFSPPVYIIPPPAYAKQVGYYTSDLGGSNQQKDRIVVDYTELILIYRDTFYDHLEGVYGSGAIPLVPSDLNLQNAHWAATKAIVDRTDLWWCGGSLKAKNPVLIEPNQSLPVPLPPANPRQVLMECIYQINGGSNSLGTTRYEPEVVFDPKNPPNTTFANEIRDRCRWIGYLNSTVMPGFVQH